MEESNKKRNIFIDIIKGIGIILVVIAHAGTKINNFIYLFHMAIFIIASGYFFKSESSNNFKNVLKFTKRKFISLWVPYVIWITLFSLLHNVFIYLNIYTNNPLFLDYTNGNYATLTPYWSFLDIILNTFKGFLFHGGSDQLAGAFWFIATLMEVTLVYCFIDYFIKNILKIKKVILTQLFISILFLLVGYTLHLNNITLFEFDKVFTCYILYFGGYLLKEYDILNKIKKGYVHILNLIVSLLILIILNNFGDVSLGLNSYKDPIFLLIASFLGFLFLYEVAFFIKKLNIIANFISLMGQNSLAILILHFLCFKIINLALVLINHKPLYLIATFPTLYNGGYWFLAYSFVGLIIPLILSIIFKNIKGKVLLTLNKG